MVTLGSMRNIPRADAGVGTSLCLAIARSWQCRDLCFSTNDCYVFTPVPIAMWNLHISAHDFTEELELSRCKAYRYTIAYSYDMHAYCFMHLLQTLEFLE